MLRNNRYIKPWLFVLYQNQPPSTSCPAIITEHEKANFPSKELGAILPIKDLEQCVCYLAQGLSVILDCLVQACAEGRRKSLARDSRLQGLKSLGRASGFHARRLSFQKIPETSEFDFPACPL